VAAFDRVSLQRRDAGLGIVRVGNHPHLHLHLCAFELDKHIAAPAALEEMHMRIVRQRWIDIFARYCDILAPSAANA